MRESCGHRVLLLAALFVACGGQIAPDPTPSTSEPVAAGGDHSGGADARPTERNGEPGAFGATCASDADCASHVCFAGGHGAFCSLHCSSDAECPAPSIGAPHCNPHGFCRY